MKLSKFILVTQTIGIYACGGEPKYRPESTQILLLASASETGGFIATLYRAPVTPKVYDIVSLWDFTISTNLPRTYKFRIYLDGREVSTSYYNQSQVINDQSFLQMLVIQTIDAPLYETPFITFAAQTPGT